MSGICKENKHFGDGSSHVDSVKDICEYKRGRSVVPTDREVVNNV